MTRRLFFIICMFVATGLFSCGEGPVDGDTPIEVPVEGISLDRDDVTLFSGESVTLEATISPEDATDKTVVWTSTNDDIATINGLGKVITFTAGEVTITVSSADGKHSATCVVVVEDRPAAVDHAIELDKEYVSLVVGNDETLVATIIPSAGAEIDLDWESTDRTVVSVDGEGRVRAMAEGEATIIARPASGNSYATCRVKVWPRENWGRSNLVWIPDERLESGGILTFAVTPGDHFDTGGVLAVESGDGTTVDVALPAIPANVQGVFFKWGSLVAVCPLGKSATLPLTLFSPTGSDYDNYNNIPSLVGFGEGVFGDSAYGDDFVDYMDGKGFDEATGKGDICRYISSRGWVKGDWRMPTHADLGELPNYVVWGDDGWKDIGAAPNEANNINGFYQPLSGYFLGGDVSRQDDPGDPAHGYSFSASGYHGNGGVQHTGYRGFIWLASSSGVEYAFCMGGNKIPDTPYQPREAGFSIRCVRDND